MRLCAEQAITAAERKEDTRERLGPCKSRPCLVHADVDDIQLALSYYVSSLRRGEKACSLRRTGSRPRESGEQSETIMVQDPA